MRSNEFCVPVTVGEMGRMKCIRNVRYDHKRDFFFPHLTISRWRRMFGGHCGMHTQKMARIQVW